MLSPIRPGIHTLLSCMLWLSISACQGIIQNEYPKTSDETLLNSPLPNDNNQAGNQQGENNGDGDNNGGSNQNTDPPTQPEPKPEPNKEEGCDLQTTWTHGQELTFEHEGHTRRFLVYLPEGYTPDRQWPLLYAIHGNGGSIERWNQLSGTKNVRTEVKDEAILILPEATKGSRNRHHWHDWHGDPPGGYEAQYASDLRYFDKVHERVTNNLCVNKDWVFTVGFSGGGSMASMLACRKTYVKAFAAGGFYPYYTIESCIQATPAWIHMTSQDAKEVRTNLRDDWREAAGCSASSQPVDPTNYCIAYDGCDEDKPIHYCTNQQNAHKWPSFGTETMWKFFQHLMDK